MDNPVKAYPAYETMSRRGASPLPSENNVIFSNETCKNQPTNPFINSQLRASGLNLARYEKIQNYTNKTGYSVAAQDIARKKIVTICRTMKTKQGTYTW